MQHDDDDDDDDDDYLRLQYDGDDHELGFQHDNGDNDDNDEEKLHLQHNGDDNDLRLQHDDDDDDYSTGGTTNGESSAEGSCVVIQLENRQSLHVLKSKQTLFRTSISKF